MGSWNRFVIAGSLLVVTVGGCGPGSAPRAAREEAAQISTEETVSVDGPLVVFLGDSLTAGYGLSEEEAYPALLVQRLRTGGRPVRIVNAGISGDTTAGGLARIDWLLSQSPEVVVVELGANDGLRGLSLEETRENLEGIIRRCLRAEAKVLLMGMKIPPSYGEEYSGGFAALFGDLAKTHEIALMPFLLEGVAADPRFNQADGIHPNAAGHRRLAASVEPYLEEVLEGL